MSHTFRFRRLNAHTYQSGTIAYWTEGSLRQSHNLAYQFANNEAQRLDVDMHAFCTVDQSYGHDNIRQLVFLMEALSNLRKKYEQQDQKLHIYSGSTQEILRKLKTQYNWGMLVVSASYCQFFREVVEDFAA